MRSSFPVGATRALRHAKRFETNVEEVKTSSQITFRDVRSVRVSGRVDRISRESTNDEGRGRVTRASLSISAQSTGDGKARILIQSFRSMPNEVDSFSTINPPAGAFGSDEVMIGLVPVE